MEWIDRNKLLTPLSILTIAFLKLGFSAHCAYLPREHMTFSLWEYSDNFLFYCEAFRNSGLYIWCCGYLLALKYIPVLWNFVQYTSTLPDTNSWEVDIFQSFRTLVEALEACT